MRSLIQQLCTTLAVADADELVPSVLQLQALCQHAGACAAGMYGDSSLAFGGAAGGTADGAENLGNKRG